jgi:hypothetical protein
MNVTILNFRLQRWELGTQTYLTNNYFGWAAVTNKFEGIWVFGKI